MNKAMTLLGCTLVSVSLVASMSANAKKRFFPLGCKTVGHSFEHGKLVLSPENEAGPQTLFFIHNSSPYGVKLISIKLPHEAFAPSYNNVIHQYDWGVFATNKSKMVFRCVYNSGHSADTVDCGKVLKLCQYPRAKFAEHNGGNYWVVKSDSKSQAIRDTSGKYKHGILLRW